MASSSSSLLSSLELSDTHVYEPQLLDLCGGHQRHSTLRWGGHLLGALNSLIRSGACAWVSQCRIFARVPPLLQWVVIWTGVNLQGFGVPHLAWHARPCCMQGYWAGRIHQGHWAGHVRCVPVNSFTSVDRLRVGWLNGWEGCRESRRYSRDTFPESYITKYTSIRRINTHTSLRRINLYK